MILPSSIKTKTSSLIDADKHEYTEASSHISSFNEYGRTNCRRNDIINRLYEAYSFYENFIIKFILLITSSLITKVNSSSSLTQFTSQWFALLQEVSQL